MDATDAISIGPEWAVHGRPGDWPVRSDSIFLVAAFDRIIQAMFRISGVELLHDPVDLSGYGTAVWSRLREAVMSGQLTTRVQPMTGGPLDHKPPTDWTPANIAAAIATGETPHRLRRKNVLHWVFVDEAELALMCKVLDATDMIPSDDGRGPLEDLGEIVLRNVPGIARPSPEHDPVAHAEAIIRMFVPSARFDFDSADDRDRFVEAVKGWLEKQFETDPAQKVPRGVFKKLAERSFGNYMSGRIFDKAWGELVAQPTKDDDGLTPDFDAPDPHKKRRTAGLR